MNYLVSVLIFMVYIFGNKTQGNGLKWKLNHIRASETTIEGRQYVPVYKYPGFVKRCPDSNDRTFGLSPIYEDGGSVCITSKEGEGMFFGPNITTLPAYARCEIKSIRRSDAMLRKLWMSPSNIYQETNLNMSTDFFDVGHFVDNGLYSTGYFDISKLPDDEKLLYSKHHMKSEIY